MLVTLAPEVPGALALIERLVAAGVRVALGHTAANPQQIAEAIRAGATLSTHLGNGCATVLPRHPNVIWEQLAADALHASLIVDGHHLPASTVKAMVRAKGVERTILVTDAIAAAGCPPGRYRIGAVECELGADGRVSLPGTPFLAGSSLTLDRAIANTVRFTGLPIEAVIPMASMTPARYLGTTTAGTVTAEWDPERFALSALTVHPGVRQNTMNIAFLDWAVLVAYLIVITAIGLVVGYRVRHSGEYFLGGRKFGPWLMIGQSFGVGTHAEMPVALAGAVYSVGASAIWYQWKNLFITPFYWLMAPVFRRIRRTTMAEFTEDRYGSWMAAIYIVFALCFFIINTGSMLKGAGKVISQATGGGVGVNEIVVAMTVMFILYSFVGGLVAAAWTDLFQGILIIVAVVHADPARLAGRRRTRRDEGVARAVPLLARDAVRHRPVGDCDADGQRPGRHHGAAAPAGRGRHRPGRAHLPSGDALRQHGEARVHRRLGASSA